MREYQISRLTTNYTGKELLQRNGFAKEWKD